jgi:hypothetical protein
MLIFCSYWNLLLRYVVHRLKDLVLRNETNKLVTDLVHLDRVGSLMKMILCRRRFREHLRKKREQSKLLYTIFSVKS